MPACSVCIHPDRKYIDAALLADQTAVSVAHDFGLSEDATGRHKRNHLVASLIKPDTDLDSIEQIGDLVAQVNALQAKTLAIYHKADQTNNHRLALQALKQAKDNLELLSRVFKTNEIEAEIDELTRMLEGGGRDDV